MPLAVVLLTVDGISFFDGSQFDGNGKIKTRQNTTVISLAVDGISFFDGNQFDGNRKTKMPVIFRRY